MDRRDSLSPSLVPVSKDAGSNHSVAAMFAAVATAALEVDAAKALIAFLTSPPVKQALTANGFEPL